MLSLLEKRKKPKVVSKSATSKLERRSVENKNASNYLLASMVCNIAQEFVTEEVLVEELKRRLN